ncbi:MAG TPA: PPOX class F420-dependent oxidoreductase [Dictyobacter sp.]|jgi:PPOX class probable F420-dependent enzyme|nr:PPOX class F420-dependent oxidoreductase [Dictyobacter sp.]
MSIPTYHLSSPSLRELYRAEYGNLVTFRKDGTPVETPIWFASRDGIFYIETGATSGKIKRIRHTARVTLAPCTARGQIIGEMIECRAHIITDVQESYIARGALHRKYGLKRQLFYAAMEIIHLFSRRSEEDLAFLALEPLASAY